MTAATGDALSQVFPRVDFRAASMDPRPRASAGRRRPECCRSGTRKIVPPATGLRLRGNGSAARAIHHAHYLLKARHRRRQLRFSVFLSNNLVNQLLTYNKVNLMAITCIRSQDVSAGDKTIYCLFYALLADQTAATQNGTGVPLAIYMAILS
jgi:hypothetical protein